MGMENANFLVVEDSPTMRQLISFSLKRFKNAKIIEAVDGVDALKKLSGPDRIDLILTDINMPVMSGADLLRHVAADERWRHLTRVIISTDGSEARREQAAELSVRCYLQKPFSPEVLRDVLTDAATTARV